jgi:hypothetical protein
MTENSISTAIYILKEILSKEIIFPEQERTAGVLKWSNYLQSSQFNISRHKLVDFMYSFEKKGLLEILSDDLISDFSIKNDSDKRLNYTIKDIALIENYINVLEKKSKDKESNSIDVEGFKSKENVIFYNHTTGLGKNNGKDFRLKDNTQEYKVFRFLYKNINEKMSRYDVLVESGFYEDGENPNPNKKTLETEKINLLVKKLRKKVSLNTKNLINNAGNITLIGIKIPNDTQVTPK